MNFIIMVRFDLTFGIAFKYYYQKLKKKKKKFK